MLFLGIVFKTRLKYSKELLTIMVKIQKLTLGIIRVTMGSWCIRKIFPILLADAKMCVGRLENHIVERAEDVLLFLMLSQNSVYH